MSGVLSLEELLGLVFGTDYRDRPRTCVCGFAVSVVGGVEVGPSIEHGRVSLCLVGIRSFVFG